MQLCGIPIAVRASDGAGCRRRSGRIYFYHTGFTLIQGAPAGMYVPLERRIWSVADDPGIHGKYRGKRQYIRAGRWCAGGAAAAHKAGDHSSEKEGKRPGGALAYCGHHRLRSGGDGPGITVYHITQEGITGGYEMPDPVGDENTETDDGQEL